MEVHRIASAGDIINAIALNNETAEKLTRCGFRLESNQLWITVPPDLDPILLAEGIQPTVKLELDYMWLRSIHLSADFLLSEFTDFFA